MRDEKGKLPEGWRWEKLGNLCKITNGTTNEQEKNNSLCPVTRIETISEGIINFSKVGYTNLSEEEKTKYKLHKYDILFSHINSFERIGHCAFYLDDKKELYHGMNLLRLSSFKKNMVPVYLFYILKSTNSLNFYKEKAQRAINQSSLNQTTLKELLIPLPPTIDDQIAIARELERKMTEVEKMRQAARRQKEAIAAMQGAILREVFPYKEGDKLPEGWRWVKIKNVVENDIQIFSPENYGKETFFYIDISSVDNVGKKILKSNQIFVKDAPSRAKSILKENDIIISTVRPNLNAVALAKKKHDGNVCSSGFCVIRLKNGYYPPYFFHYFISPYFVETISKMVQGAMYPAINDYDVKNFSIPLPSTIDDQIAIANELERKMAEIDKIRQSVDRQLEAIEALPGAILREVFDFEGE